jgi:LmbE family N-acetylglucosaminyl deacetylase
MFVLLALGIKGVTIADVCNLTGVWHGNDRNGDYVSPARISITQDAAADSVSGQPLGGLFSVETETWSSVQGGRVFADGTVQVRLPHRQLSGQLQRLEADDRGPKYRCARIVWSGADEGRIWCQEPVCMPAVVKIAAAPMVSVGGDPAAAPANQSKVIVAMEVGMTGHPESKYIYLRDNQRPAEVARQHCTTENYDNAESFQHCVATIAEALFALAHGGRPAGTGRQARTVSRDAAATLANVASCSFVQRQQREVPAYGAGIYVPALNVWDPPPPPRVRDWLEHGGSDKPGRGEDASGSGNGDGAPGMAAGGAEGETERWLESLGAGRGVDRLMVVAHPDDEAIFGGDDLLPAAVGGADAGSGSSSNNSSGGGWMLVVLTNDHRRQRPLRAAARVLGVRALVQLSHMASAKPRMQVDATAAAMVSRLVSARRWAVVSTHNANGEYGHVQHLHVHQLVKQALVALPPHRRPFHGARVFCDSTDVIAPPEGVEHKREAALRLTPLAERAETGARIRVLERLRDQLQANCSAGSGTGCIGFESGAKGTRPPGEWPQVEKLWLKHAVLESLYGLSGWHWMPYLRYCRSSEWRPWEATGRGVGGDEDGAVTVSVVVDGEEQAIRILPEEEEATVAEVFCRKLQQAEHDVSRCIDNLAATLAHERNQLQYT